MRLGSCPNLLQALYYFNYKVMSNRDSYVCHPLNISPTKQSHSFSKSLRFQHSQRIATEAVYELPSTFSKRSTSFGYGEKQQFINKKILPPPGSYRLKSDFETNDKNGVSIAVGRQKVTFGSFLLQALKKTRNLPSPDRYNPHVQNTPKGGGMHSRLKTDFDLKEKKHVPGPGSYKLTAVQVGNKGRYPLSNMKNIGSPRYYSTGTVNKQKPSSSLKKSQSILQRQIVQKQIGKYQDSRYKNVPVRTFGKGERPGLQDKSKLLFPGFKYRRFSQFGTFL